MSAAPTPDYEIRVDGHLDQHWSAVLAGLTIRHDADGSSTLTGRLADQAQLHGVLKGLQNIGATLLTVTAPRATSTADAVPTAACARPLDRARWPARTQRLTLRPARAEDADATWAFRRMEQVARWLTEIPAEPDAFRTQFRDPERLASTLVIERDGDVIGDLMLRVEDAWGQTEVAPRAAGTRAELAWVLHPDHTGVGYATEGVRELLRIAFADVGVRRVTATCFADNVASWRLMERLGMRRELHAVADALHRDGTWHDTYGYALLRDEWIATGAGPS